jgi:hypothetical protein
MPTTEGTNGRDPALRLFHVAGGGWGARRLLRKTMRDSRTTQDALFIGWP